MAGGGPEEGVLRHGHPSGGSHGTGVGDPQPRQEGGDALVAVPAGIGQAADGVANQVFEVLAVLHDLAGDAVLGLPGERRMGDGVAGDFVAVVEILQLGAGDVRGAVETGS